jgi:hypothetical protein
MSGNGIFVRMSGNGMFVRMSGNSTFVGICRGTVCLLEYVGECYVC